MAAYSPDPGAMPGEDPQGPDQSAVDAVNSAINQGYSYDDVAAFHADNNLPAPPQPSLDAIMSGNTSDASQWSQPQLTQDNDPTKLDTAEQVAPLINQIAESGMGIGSVEGVGMRAAKMGVEATTEALTPAMTKIDLAVERADQAMGTLPGKAAKWIAAGVGADLAGGPHRVGVHPEKGE